MRRTDDTHAWSWRDNLSLAHDAFCVTRASNASLPVAFWCSTARRLLRLQDGLAYRLDCVEVDPTLRGAEVGLFALALVATRALECGANRIVLGALPQAKKFY